MQVAALCCAAALLCCLTHAMAMQESVDRFNSWFADEVHNHSKVLVMGAVVGGEVKRLGLVLKPNVALSAGEAYLVVNSSLSLSVRSLLCGGLEFSTASFKNLRSAVVKFVGTKLGISTRELQGDALPDLVRKISAQTGKRIPHRCRTLAGNGFDAANPVLLQRYASLCMLVNKIIRSLPVEDAESLVIVYLLHERFAEGAQSFYKPYIDILPPAPEDISTPIFFSDEKLHRLRGTAIPDRVMQYRRRVSLMYQSMVDGLFSQFSSDYPFDPTIFSLRHFQWGFGILMTRQVWWDNEAHLSPMTDLANCQESTDGTLHKTEAVFDTGGGGERIVTRSSLGVDLVADGETAIEVFENYGESNSFYMLFHGFTLASNSKDCGIVVLKDFSSPRYSTLWSQKTRTILQRGGFLRDAPCVRGVREGTAAGALELEEDGPSPSLKLSVSVNQYLSLLRAAYLITHAEQPNEYQALVRDNMKALRTTSDFLKSLQTTTNWHAESTRTVLRIGKRILNDTINGMMSPRGSPSGLSTGGGMPADMMSLYVSQQRGMLGEALSMLTSIESFLSSRRSEKMVNDEL